MSIEKELHDELVEGVEAVEEVVEATEPKGGKAGEVKDVAKDGQKAADETSAAVKSSAKKKAAEPTSGGGDAMEKLKEEAEEEESFKEDLDALVDSEATLSEGFRSKAGLIFEAALSAKLKTEVARLEESYEERLSEEVTSIRSELEEQVDGYLNYVVENWMEENKLAIETGLRAEIAESFIESLKDVFAEHYVEVPEGKTDLVEELAAKVEALEEKYNEAIDRNIELNEEVDALTREKLIVEASEGLSVAQAEKLKSLVEDVAFEDAETFSGKVETIKESYFKKTVVSEPVVEELTEETQVEVSPMMARYLEALKKS